MPVVPSSLDALLFLFAGAFSAPTFRTFRMLVVGFICRVGEHTVCGMLQAARLERVWHHSRAHAFFSERQWCPDKLGLLLLDFLVARFVAEGAPIRVAVDDSLFHRAGKQVYGAAWQYDGSVPQGAGRESGYGNNWVSLCLIVRLPFLRRPVGLPVLFRLWRPDPKAKPRNRCSLARSASSTRLRLVMSEFSSMIARGRPVRTVLQRLPTGDHDHRAVLAGMTQLAGPVSLPRESLIDRLLGLREDRREQIMQERGRGLLPGCSRRSPAPRGSRTSPGSRPDHARSPHHAPAPRARPATSAPARCDGPRSRRVR